MSVGCVVNVLNESELRKKKKPLENAKIAVNISGKVSNKIFCGYCGKVFSQLSVCLFFLYPFSLTTKLKLKQEKEIGLDMICDLKKCKQTLFSANTVEIIFSLFRPMIPSYLALNVKSEQLDCIFSRNMDRDLFGSLKF